MSVISPFLALFFFLAFGVYMIYDALKFYIVPEVGKGIITKIHRSFFYIGDLEEDYSYCLLYTSPSPRDATLSRMPSSA